MVLEGCQKGSVQHFQFLYVKLEKMKILIILSFVFLTASSRISCSFPDRSISIKHSQYDHYYEMTAQFNPDKNDKVDRYLDKELATDNISFVSSEMDADITLDDKTTFYVKKSPGQKY